MLRPLKWDILGACTIILSKDIHKMLENSFSWIYQFEGDAQNLQFINGLFTTISGHFFINFIKIFHKTEVPTIILRCITYLNLDWIKSYDMKHKFFCFCFFASYMNLTILTKTDESMKGYFPAISWISFDKIIVQTPSISHFKGLGMRNLEYQIAICQKIHTKVTITMSMLSRFLWNRR